LIKDGKILVKWSEIDHHKVIYYHYNYYRLNNKWSYLEGKQLIK
jgi:hypothetical protein